MFSEMPADLGLKMLCERKLMVLHIACIDTGFTLAGVGFLYFP